jgi:hypothetical protein
MQAIKMNSFPRETLQRNLKNKTFREELIAY